jgi:hypothetical protein
LNNKAESFCDTADATTSTTIRPPDRTNPYRAMAKIDNALAKHIKKYLGLKA